MLINKDMQIVGVIYWEFTYSAPAEFSYSPPSWLLLVMPEEWPQGVANWAKHYQPRLDMLLSIMKEREDHLVLGGALTDGQRLSVHMRESWESGAFWITYGARKSWAFDAVWPFIMEMMLIWKKELRF